MENPAEAGQAFFHTVENRPPSATPCANHQAGSGSAAPRSLAFSARRATCSMKSRLHISTIFQPVSHTRTYSHRITRMENRFRIIRPTGRGQNQIRLNQNQTRLFSPLPCAAGPTARHRSTWITSARFTRYSGIVRPSSRTRFRSDSR